MQLYQNSLASNANGMVLKYLKQTSNLDITYAANKSDSSCAKAYADASTSGYIIQMTNGPVI